MFIFCRVKLRSTHHHSTLSYITKFNFRTFRKHLKEMMIMNKFIMIAMMYYGFAVSLPLAGSAMSIDIDDDLYVEVPPIIDIDALIHPDRYDYHDIEKMRSEIYHASQRWGFFQVLNHSIPEQLQHDIVHSMVQLFGSSHELKNSIRRSVTNSRGFADDELTKRQKDMKEVFDIGQQVPHQDLSAAAMINQGIDGTNQWPDPHSYPHLQGFQATVLEYFLQCTQLSNRLFQLLITPFLECEQVNDNTTTQSYDDDDDDVRNAFNKHSSFMRLNYYPLVNTSHRNEQAVGSDASDVDGDAHSGKTIKTSAEPLGVSRHTDSGALTVLLQVSSHAVQGYDGIGQDSSDYDDDDVLRYYYNSARLSSALLSSLLVYTIITYAIQSIGYFPARSAGV